MAKMYYTLEEAAQKLGVDEQAVKQMIDDGKLQQFSDDGKETLKCSDVDALADNDATADADDSGGPIELADVNDDSAIGDTIELADESGQDAGDANSATDTAIELADEDDEHGVGITGGSGLLDLDDDSDDELDADPSGSSDIIDLSSDTLSNESASDQSGIDVFDSGEIEAADSMAQTHMADAEDEDEDDFNLESVGSGSGLLDLTQESDDTSLGADLLDEIYPGSDEGSSTSVFADDSEGSSMGGLAGLGQQQEVESAEDQAAATAQMVQMSGQGYYDPAGSGFSGGMLLGALIVLIVALIVTIAAVMGITSPITTYLSKSPMTLGIWCIGLLILSFILALIGRIISKSLAT